MSPLVDSGLVIAHVGGDGRGAVVALDARSGAAKWSWDGDGPAYASPILVHSYGVRQIVTQTQRYLVGIDVTSGTLLWRLPFTTSFDQNIVTPVRRGDVLIFSGLSQPTFGVRLSRGPAGWKADRVWENPQVSMYMNSPVVVGDWLFGLSHKNKGQLVCLDAGSGRVLWESEGRQGENAAVVAGGGVLYVLSSEGELIVVKTTPKAYEPLRTYTVADTPTWAHPVVLGDRVLVKNENTLASWSIGSPGALALKGTVE
jgi:outer membrane protein assembly factor BamB